MLTNKTEILKHRELSRGVKDEKLQPYIDDAENLDLKPLLGSSFYLWLDDNKDDGDVVDAILKPKKYTYNGENYSHPGLYKVASLFAWARHVLHGSNTDTPFGFQQKTHQNSAPVSTSGKKQVYTMDRQAAMQYYNEVRIYIERNIEDYPKWKTNCKRSGSFSGFRVSKIN